MSADRVSALPLAGIKVIAGPHAAASGALALQSARTPGILLVHSPPGPDPWSPAENRAGRGRRHGSLAFSGKGQTAVQTDVQPATIRQTGVTQMVVASRVVDGRRCLRSPLVVQPGRLLPASSRVS